MEPLKRFSYSQTCRVRLDRDDDDVCRDKWISDSWPPAAMSVSFTPTGRWVRELGEKWRWESIRVGCMQLVKSYCLPVKSENSRLPEHWYSVLRWLFVVHSWQFHVLEDKWWDLEVDWIIMESNHCFIKVMKKHTHVRCEQTPVRLQLVGVMWVWMGLWPSRRMMVVEEQGSSQAPPSKRFSRDWLIYMRTVRDSDLRVETVFLNDNGSRSDCACGAGV